MQTKMINYGNIPEEEIQVYKTYKHMKRGITSLELSKTMRISYPSAINKLDSSNKTGRLIFKWEYRANRRTQVYYPSTELIDRIETIEKGGKE